MTTVEEKRKAAMAKTAEAYAAHYGGAKPQCVAAAPGRVNLIGEHVDHQGYSVCPIAIEATTRVAGGPASGSARLQIQFGVSSVTESFDVPFSSLQVAPTTPASNYAMAALFGVAEFFMGGMQAVGTLVPRGQVVPSAVVDWLTEKAPDGLRLYVEGEVPIAAGVSSSSALVVACTLVYMELLGLSAAADVLAASTALAECHVGTASGGMDQASILLSQAGKALLIDFNPVKATPVELPPSARFVVLNSCVHVPKAVQAATCYNKRVFELKTACAKVWLEQRPGLPVPPMRQLTVRRVQEELRLDTAALEALFVRIVGLQAYSTAECCEILTVAGLLESTLDFVGKAVVLSNTIFEPCRRVQHVLSENVRVQSFISTLRDTTMCEEDKLMRLGKLMDGSQTSMTLQYDAGVPELDEITSMARLQDGCYGSRVTGAGWGGCTVSLVHASKVEAFCRAMSAYFHRTDRPRPLDTRGMPLESLLFAVNPGSGATLLKLDSDGELASQSTALSEE